MNINCQNRQMGHTVLRTSPDAAGIAKRIASLAGLRVQRKLPADFEGTFQAVPVYDTDPEFGCFYNRPMPDSVRDRCRYLGSFTMIVVPTVKTGRKSSKHRIFAVVEAERIPVGRLHTALRPSYKRDRAEFVRDAMDAIRHQG